LRNESKKININFKYIILKIIVYKIWKLSHFNKIKEFFVNKIKWLILIREKLLKLSTIRINIIFKFLNDQKYIKWEKKFVIN